MAKVRRLGIRGRVVASFLVLLVAAELVGVLVVHEVGTARLDEQADRDLTVAADELRARVDQLERDQGGLGTAELQVAFDDYLRARPARADEAFVTFVSGRPFASSAGAPVALDSLPVAARWAGVAGTEAGRADTDAGPMRWLAVPVVGDGQVLGVLVAARFLADGEDALTGTIVTVSIVTVLVLVAACLLAWGAAGRALAPLHQLATTARSVSDGSDLSARIDVTGSDEVGALARSFNGMLDRLQGAFDSQTRFLDDAGHQLRTPITIVRGHVELLDDDPEQREADVALVLDELDRMDRLVADLRVLARSGRPDFLEPEDVELSQLVEEVARKAGALADRRWAVRTGPPARLRADRHRLTEALLNLVDNAVRATQPGDTVELGTAVHGATAELWVRDTGCGIDPADVPHLFERGGNRVRHRPGGTGLGLPIVAAIAAAHGGDVTATSVPGDGTCVRLLLPTDAEEAR